MLPLATGSEVYTDFQGLERLRAQARDNPQQALRETARQFEALFMQMLLKSMREAKPADDPFSSPQSDLYRDMFDQQLAINLSKNGALGIADLLQRQLGGAAPPEQKTLNPFTARVFSGAPASLPPAETAGAAPQRAWAAPAAGDIKIDSPRAFIAALWPYAEQAARELGAEPQTLLAQAALESGWGQQMIEHADGRNSHNLFGIKANAGWEGERAVVPTLEYENGIAQRQRAAFRAYDSFAESFRDYVQFLRVNPRYRQALEVAHDPAAFAQALQDAGYSTDPRYAQKILGLLHSGAFNNALAEASRPNIVSLNTE
ncbi:MAG: flagellar assembly peptidoglycan hydrolase FlgJ [Gammaproteobacteria bacterium]|nr:MAG: flagellar assembly peptidoglycan hydrolase FlgJ [Gammaproteobacteria bacterium]